MNIDVLRRRLLARLTSLPEIVYALTRHWVLLSICLCGGGAFMLAKVSTEAVVYEGKATLSLHAGEAMLVDQDRRSDAAAADASRFYASRVEILTSDTVLRRLVDELKTEAILSQESNPEEATYGTLRRAIGEVKRRYGELMSYLEHPDVRDTGPENNTQRAVSSLRRRSQVLQNPRTGTIGLRVYGNDRDLLLRELEAWIDAYQNRLVVMAEESREIFINSRTRFWKRKVDDAKEVLDAFKREHPDVSKAAQDLLLQQILRLELRREDLSRELELGEPQAPPPDDTRAKDPGTQALLAQKLDLEKRLIETIPIHGEGSDVVRSLKESLQIVEGKLKGLDPSKGSDPEARRREVREQLEKHAALIGASRARHAQHAAVLDELQGLESEYKRAQDTHENYRLMLVEEGDRGEMRKMVQVQVADKPVVSWQPFNTYPHRQVLYGSAAGLALGVALALLAEVLATRVRFKSDIVNELGVPVVGVIPRK
ncbi:MAG: hypothetical protein HY721_18015 [Planctomycetes bacterium]|nr:hypothetical protein [Planctomycetota bacterium]